MKKNAILSIVTLILVLNIGLSPELFAVGVSPKDSLRNVVVREAGYLLDNSSISYAYGGGQLGKDENCSQCNRCIETKRPAPKRQLAACPVCYTCSLDCSHFIQLVFERAGVKFPYLTTDLMINLGSEPLRLNYGFQDIGFNVQKARRADLLVYSGHVVLLETNYGNGRGDVIHVTSGKDIRSPGEAIQRERNVDLALFRGSLQRILRHSAVSDH